MDEIEAQWRQLDPIFILGRQRTGTSIMWRALRVAGFFGFPEDHLWYDLIKPLAWWRDPEYKAHLREEIFALGAGRNLLLERQIALLIDQFHRDQLPPECVRWVSKSPGVDAVLVAPMLAEIFPQAQFIFMKRNAITTVNSTIAYMQRNHDSKANVDAVFLSTCKHWVAVMKMWRQVRPLLTGRYIEVAQEHIVTEPGQVARRVTDFLGVPEWSQAVADVFKSRRENTAFPEKDVGDFFYPVDWTREQKQVLARICGPEMAVWGYPLNFQYPGGPQPPEAASGDITPMDMSTYYRWVREYETHELRLMLQRYRELLDQISRGRVMRLLNWLNRVAKRFDVRRQAL
ncbi:MAG TPA: sulfotransferase [Thermoflexia bacterium]|jgi:hypothetical protein|nr:sulfotransferase [Thermoflexia bacterium]